MEELVVKFGPEVAMICVVAIFLVGCVKLILKKQFEMVEKTSRKTIYESCSIVVAFGLTALWLFLEGKFFGGEGFSWMMFGKEGAVVYSAMKVAYSLYENFKLRDLFSVAGKAVISVFSKKKKELPAPEESEEEDKEEEHTVNII